MATVEAVEGWLARSRTESPRLFSNVEYLVVDELHVFMSSELGPQLQLLLERLDDVTGTPARRFGLSNTRGSTRRACDFLRPPTNEDAIVIEEWKVPEL
jgi:ATP-dependent Lhr-like helicase